MDKPVKKDGNMMEEVKKKDKQKVCQTILGRLKIQ